MNRKICTINVEQLFKVLFYFYIWIGSIISRLASLNYDRRSFTIRDIISFLYDNYLFYWRLPWIWKTLSLTFIFPCSSSDAISSFIRQMCQSLHLFLSFMLGGDAIWQIHIVKKFAPSWIFFYFIWYVYIVGFILQPQTQRFFYPQWWKLGNYT